MSVTREEVAKIAQLARISMDEDDLDKLVPEFNYILANSWARSTPLLSSR